MASGAHVAVIGGAGFGKTSLLSAWSEGRRAAWLCLDEEDAHPHKFMRYLVAAFEQVLTGFVSEAALLLDGDGTHDSAATSLSALLADLDEQADLPMVLILDDFHRAESEVTSTLLGRLLSYLPETLRVVLSARRPPAIQIANMVARRQIVIFGEAELAFDLDELAQLRPEIDQEGCREILARTGGWPAGMGMDPVTQEAFIEEQFLCGLGSDVRVFLLAAAQVDFFFLRDCEPALGLRVSNQMKDRMVAQQLLRGLGGGRYEVPQPLRGFLRFRLAEELDEEERSRLLGRLGFHLWRQEQYLTALSCWLESGDREVAVESLVGSSQSWLQAGNLDLLEAALGCFSGQYEDDPGLLLLDGEIHRRRGNFDRAEQRFQTAHTLFSAQGNASAAAECRLREAQAFASQGKVAAAREAMEAIAPVIDRAGRLEADWLNLEAGLSLYEGNVGQAAIHLEHSLAAARRLGDPIAEARAAHNLGVCLTRLGKLQQALAAYEAALPVGGKVPRVFLTPINRALVLIFMGRVEEARSAAEEALALVRLYRLAREEGYALRTLGHACMELGDFETALVAFEAAIELSRRIQDRMGLAISLNYRADLALILHDVENSLALSDQARSTFTEGEGFQSLEFAYVHSRILLALGRGKEAFDETAGALAEAKRHGYKYWVYSFSLVAAEAARESFQTSEALRLDKAAADLAESQGYGPTLLSRSPSGKEAESTGMAARVSSDRQAQTELTSPPLSISLFGGLRVVRHGIEIPDREWQSVRAKILLAFLLEQKSGTVKSCLIEAVYGLDGGSDASFNMTLARLRRALEPDLETGRTSRYILRADGQYGFNWQARVEIDTAKFDTALRPPIGPHSLVPLKRALAAYHGDYLAGFDTDWIIALRQRYRDKALAICRHLLELLREAAPAERLAFIYRALEIDPLSEEFNREAILHFIEAGEGHRAAEHYRLCRKRYESFNLDPPEDLAGLVPRADRATIA